MYVGRYALCEGVVAGSHFITVRLGLIVLRVVVGGGVSRSDPVMINLFA